MDNHTLLIIFVALTAVSVLLQAIVLIGILAAVKKTTASLTQTTQDLKATILPVVHSTRELVERIAPQVVTVTNGMAELTELLRRETKGVQISASEIMGRVNRQTERLDAMLTASLNVLERTGVLLESAVAAPVRQANGVLAAVRAVIETYRTTVPLRSSESTRRAKATETDRDYVI